MYARGRPAGPRRYCAAAVGVGRTRHGTHLGDGTTNGMAGGSVCRAVGGVGVGGGSRGRGLGWQIDDVLQFGSEDGVFDAGPIAAEGLWIPGECFADVGEHFGVVRDFGGAEALDSASEEFDAFGDGQDVELAAGVVWVAAAEHAGSRRC